MMRIGIHVHSPGDLTERPLRLPNGSVCLGLRFFVKYVKHSILCFLDDFPISLERTGTRGGTGQETS